MEKNEADQSGAGRLKANDSTRRMIGTREEK